MHRVCILLLSFVLGCGATEIVNENSTLEETEEVSEEEYPEENVNPY